MKKNDLEKLQTLAASSVTAKETKERHAKSTIYAEQESVKQHQQSASAQYITDSILVFTTLGVELGSLLTKRQKNIFCNSLTKY